MVSENPAPLYPECEKMAAARPKTQIIGEFIEWLAENGMQICEYQDEEESDDDAYWPIRRSMEQLLADFMGIDLAKAEKEKRAILDRLRERNG